MRVNEGSIFLSSGRLFRVRFGEVGLVQIEGRRKSWRENWNFIFEECFFKIRRSGRRIVKRLKLSIKWWSVSIGRSISLLGAVQFQRRRFIIR